MNPKNHTSISHLIPSVNTNNSALSSPTDIPSNIPSRNSYTLLPNSFLDFNEDLVTHSQISDVDIAALSYPNPSDIKASTFVTEDLKPKVNPTQPFTVADYANNTSTPPNPFSPPIKQPITISQPENPISSSAETASSSTNTQEIFPIQEIVEHDKLDEEVKPYIEVKPQNVEIPLELKRLGLHPISKAKFKDYKNIKLPLSDDKIALGMKAPISSSLRWLAMFALYLLQQSHLTIKVIHGKAVRIIKK